jgi:hypothetical protein
VAHQKRTQVLIVTRPATPFQLSAFSFQLSESKSSDGVKLLSDPRERLKKHATRITGLQFGGTEHLDGLLFEQAPLTTWLALSDPFVHHAGVDPAKSESVA